MDLNTFDLNLLTTFEAIFDERSVTKAAVRLCLTQSATSNSLNRLRVAFSDKLFVPGAKGMMPTPLASELIGNVRASLSLIRDSLTPPTGFDAAKTERAFNLRLTDMGEILFLPRFLRHIQEIAPKVRIRSVRVTLDELQDQLADGEIDVAIGFLPGIGQGIRQQRLFDDRYVCAVRKNHPCASRPLTLAAFRSMTHVLVRPQGSGNLTVERAYSRHGISISGANIVSHLVSVPYIISTTDLIVTIPKRLGIAFSESAQLQLMDPPINIPDFVVRQHWHERFQNDPASMWLRRCIETVGSTVEPKSNLDVRNAGRTRKSLTKKAA